MDTSFVIVCLILVGSVFIPFFLFNSAGKKNAKRFGVKVKEVIAKNNLNISDSENWGDTYIGMDTNQRKILYLKFKASENLKELVDLDTMQTCQIAEKRKVVKINDKKELILEKLDLEILLKNSESLLLNFYDINEDRTEDYELQRIEKWKAMILAVHKKNLSENKTAMFKYKILSA